MKDPTKRLRLPDKLVYKAFQIAALGTLACSASTAGSAPDAAGGDALSEATDSPAAVDVAANDSTSSDVSTDDGQTQDGSFNDAYTGDTSMSDALVMDSGLDSFSTDGCVMYCGPSGTVDGAVCPGVICDLSQCPLDAGCEPFV